MLVHNNSLWLVGSVEGLLHFNITRSNFIVLAISFNLASNTIGVSETIRQEQTFKNNIITRAAVGGVLYGREFPRTRSGTNISYIQQKTHSFCDV